MVCALTSRGGPQIIQVGKPVEATSGLNRGCVWIGWAGKLFAARLRIRGNTWNGPYGKAIRARNPSGRGTMTTEPLEQQALGHGFLNASLGTTFRDGVFRQQCLRTKLLLTKYRSDVTSRWLDSEDQGTPVPMVPRRQAYPSGYIARTPRPMHLTPHFFVRYLVQSPMRVNRNFLAISI